MSRPLGANRINDFFMGQKSVSKLNEAYQMSGGKVLTPNGRNSNSFQAKSTFEQGTAKRGAYSFSSGSSGRGSSPFFGGRTGAVHNTAPRLHGTNHHINTRNTTAFTKGLGGAAIAKAGMTYAQAFVKYGPLGLGALLFLDIVLADGGLESGTLPEYLRQPGESEEIQPPQEPPFYGGQMNIQYSVTIRVRVVHPLKPGFFQDEVVTKAATGPIRGLEYDTDSASCGSRTGTGSKIGTDKFCSIGVNLGAANPFLQRIATIFYEDPPSKPPGQNIVEITAVTPRYGQEDTGGNLPSAVGTTTSSTTNNSTATAEKATVNNPPPSGIRPPFPSEKTANPTPSSSFTKPKPSKSSVVKQAVVKTPEGNIETNNNLNTNNSGSPTPAKQQSKLEAPSEIPEPIPTPKPPKEKSIQEVEQPKEPEIPVIISDTQVRRADGTTQRTVQKSATPEEMEEYTRKANEAEIKRQGAAEVNQEYQNFLDLGYSELENREPSELDKYKQEFRDKTEANKRSPFGKIDWFTSTPSKFDGTDDWKHPFNRPDEKSVEKQPQKTTNLIPAPEPDRQPQPDQSAQPGTQPQLEPVKQTPTVDDPIKEKLDNLPSKEDIALIVGGLDIVQQITNATASGLNPLCQAHTLQPSIDRNNTNTGLARAAILGQGQVTQTAVNTANATLTHSTWGLQAIVTNGAYGLQKIQGFAETAWKVTRADKIMAGVTMALTIHNAMMLSNNLASTISEALNMSLNALGIRNEEDKEIDIGTAVRNKINEVMSSILGAENYAALTARIAKANRIYQTGINLLDTTYSLFDSARTVAELTAENTGKIGNALRESGAVYEDAYDEFLEKVNPQNASQRKLEKFREGLESVENVFDTVSQISGSVVETKENIQQIKEEKNNLVEEINTQIETKKDEKDTAKTQIQVTTDINDNDFDRGTEEI